MNFAAIKQVEPLFSPFNFHDVVAVRALVTLTEENEGDSQEKTPGAEFASGIDDNKVGRVTFIAQVVFFNLRKLILH